MNINTTFASNDLILEDPTIGECHGKLSESMSFNTTNVDLPFVLTAHTVIQFECPGSGYNLTADERVHLTVNPDGTMTASFDDLDNPTCR